VLGEFVMTVAVKELVVDQHQAIDLLQSVAIERPLHRFTLEKYHWLIEHGFFQPEDRVELIEGFLVEMSPMHPPHAFTVDSLTEELITKIKRRAQVRMQQPITLPKQITEPEPDFVLAVRAQYYRTRHPLPADILLVGEVSDSTLAYDRGRKARLYAEARLPEYWIVNLIDNVLEVYHDPMGSGNKAGYKSQLIYKPGETVAPIALPTCHIDLTTIFFGTADDLLPDTEE